MPFECTAAMDVPTGPVYACRSPQTQSTGYYENWGMSTDAEGRSRGGNPV